MKPLNYLVDETDEVIGEAQRHEIDFAQDIYRVTGVWVINSDNQALIAQRKFTKKKDPGLWGPSVAGTVEVGETYDDNARKEAEEEIGMQGFELTKLEKIRVRTPQNYFCQYYGVKVDWPVEKFVAQEDEVEQLRWVNIDDLKQDIQNNPEKYIKSMAQSLTVLEEAKEKV